MKKITKLCLINICLTIIGLTFAYGQSADRPLSQGEKLFKENKPKEAVQVLENELLNGVVSANTYNFLGLGYYQLGDYSKSIDAFNRGIEAQPSNVKILSFNQGNTYYAMKDFSSAVRCYSTAIREDPDFSDAYLNRANALLMSDQLGNARSEYIDFITKYSEDPQKTQIERLIKALTDEIARREEEARLLEEQNKAMWEEIDPSFDEMAGLETQWEKVDATIEEEDNSDKTDWENVDASIAEENTTVKKDWENVDASIAEQEKPKNKTDWEKIDNSNTQKELNNSNLNSELVERDKNGNQIDSSKVDWEKIDSEKYTKYDELSLYENDDDLTPHWENLSEEEAIEMKRLERESRLEYEKWLEEQSLIRQREAEEELRKLQMRDDQERLSREKLLEEMMKAEEARRKQLLDNLANSLQNGDSTNVSSGADELIEYDQEGELD